MADHEKTKTVIKRFTRAMVCSIIGAVVTLQTDNPTFLILIPLLQAVGKYLRIKWGVKNIPF